MASAEFKVDTKELEQIAKLFKMAPKELQKPVSRYLGDMAWDFKVNIPKVLDSTYTIRDKKILNPQTTKPFFFIERPKATTPIDEQRAVAGTLRIDGGQGGLFTGWEEELTGKPRELRKGRGAYHRGIGGNAREDSSIYGKVLGKYKLRSGSEGFNSDRLPDSRRHPELSIPQFIAMIAKSSAAGRSKKARRFKDKDYALGKNKVFIMGGPNAPLGLYALKDGKVQRMQTFHEQPVHSEVGKFDWQSEAVEMTAKKFTPEYIWQKYIAPMINALFDKK